MQPVYEQIAFEDSPVAILYERYAHIILTYISRYALSKEDADDLVLEVFIAAMENQIWATLGEQEQLAWLRRVAYNKAVDRYRWAARHPSTALESVANQLYEDEQRTPEYLALRNEDYALLRLHISNLSELQQEIVRLRFAYGLPSKEIARRLNKSDTSVRVLLSRALNILRTIYNQQEER